jgi:hypothetical protein
MHTASRDLVHWEKPWYVITADDRGDEGEIRVGLLGREGQPARGFEAAQCRPIQGDSLAHRVEWHDPPAALPAGPLSIEFQLRDARLYGFDVLP